MANQNKQIGIFNLTGIAPARRGVPQIEVSFDIDANGILKVSAKDKATGKEQEIRIEASSGLSKEEIERMKAEAEANADADKKERERIDKINQADSMIFQTENFIKDNGDKLPAEDKPAIESAVEALKKAKESGDIAQIDKAIEGLNNAMQTASQKMYAAGGAGQAGSGAGFNPGDAGFQGGAQPNDGAQSNGADDVQDADFEEVH
jgi:molecular chaperone DnaK